MPISNPPAPAPPLAHEGTHVAGGSDDIDSALAIAAMANLTNTKIWQGNAGNRPVEIALPAGGYTEGARAYHNANQNIPHATLTVLALNSERYDTDTIHDNAINNSRLTCKTAGKYVIAGSVNWLSHATGFRTLEIILNGVTILADNRTGLVPAAGVRQTVTTIYHLDVGNYVELYVFQDSTAALTIYFSANYSPEFAMQRIG